MLFDALYYRYYQELSCGLSRMHVRTSGDGSIGVYKIGFMFYLCCNLRADKYSVTS